MTMTTPPLSANALGPFGGPTRQVVHSLPLLMAALEAQHHQPIVTLRDALL